MPEYDLSKAVKLPVPDDVEFRGGMGPQKGLVSEDKNFVLYNGYYGAEHSDFLCYNVRTGKMVFAYPNNYVGVHGGHLAPPARTGLIRAAYDIAGTVKMPPPLENLFVIATDKGEWHLLSSSGYYVGQSFRGRSDADQVARRGGSRRRPESLAARHGGGRLRRLGDAHERRRPVRPGRQDGLHQLQGDGAGDRQGPCLRLVDDRPRRHAQGAAVQGEVSPRVGIEKNRGGEAEISGADRQARRGLRAQPISFGSDSAPIQAWLAYDARKLYVAWQVDDRTPWINGATGFENMYAHGDTVDLQLGTDPAADKTRTEAGKGDLRLSIGRLLGKNTAVVYRRVSDRKAPSTFYSGTCKDGYTMEFVKRLESVAIEARTNGDRQYVVEAAIPLQELGLRPGPGLKLRGDVGATYGDPAGQRTSLRVYWSNKATGIVADEVEELKMQPALWGELDFE